ncbi:Uncharacterised protein [Streptococcus pneumoniae]|uniref:hypothetical protein n=1 Tax=Streptococcus infantis TaxID=68892 RepID=UPI001BC5BC04|nr:Uncharacterised protein [Streptococcus pneumoniae]
MIDFSKEIKKKNDNDDEEPQLEKDYTHDMKKKREKEEGAKKKLIDQELINKFEKLEKDMISKSENRELGMEK